IRYIIARIIVSIDRKQIRWEFHTSQDLSKNSILHLFQTITDTIGLSQPTRRFLLRSVWEVVFTCLTRQFLKFAWRHTQSTSQRPNTAYWPQVISWHSHFHAFLGDRG